MADFDAYRLTLYKGCIFYRQNANLGIYIDVVNLFFTFLIVGRVETLCNLINQT